MSAHKKSPVRSFICLPRWGGKGIFYFAEYQMCRLFTRLIVKSRAIHHINTGRSFQAVSVSAYQITASRCRISMPWPGSYVRARIKQRYVMGRVVDRHARMQKGAAYTIWPCKLSLCCGITLHDKRSLADIILQIRANTKRITKRIKTMINRNIFMARKKAQGTLPTGKKLKPLRKYNEHQNPRWVGRKYDNTCGKVVAAGDPFTPLRIV